MYTRFCAALARLCLQVGVLGLMLLIVAVLYQVIGRYVFNDTPTWAESGAVLLVLYVTMLGMAVGVRDAGHIGLESLLVLAPEGLRLKMELLIHALVLVFGAVMAYQCSVLARHLPWPVAWLFCFRSSTSLLCCAVKRWNPHGTDHFVRELHAVVAAGCASGILDWPVFVDHPVV
jgi:hypothetical protein